MLIGNSFAHFKNNDGSPLDGGFVYIGQVDKNPETNPIVVYWDAELTQPAAQPIRTLNGCFSRNGSIANLYTSSNYSITVKNKNSELCYSLPNSTKFDSTAFVQTGSTVTRTISDKLREVVSVKDFGAVGDGVTDDTAAFVALLNYVKERAFVNIDIPPGLYVVNTTISFKRLWFFTVNARGAVLTPKTGVAWSQKPVVEFASCYMGEVHGLSVENNMTNAAYWAAVAPVTNLPTCGLMLRRELVGAGWTIQGLGIAGGDGCQSVKFYNCYIKGWFEKAALVNTRAETIYFEGCIIGGMSCAAVIDTITPSQVYQSDAVANSNRDKKFKMCEFHIENYSPVSDTQSVIELWDGVLDFCLERCYFALGGIQSTADVVAAVLLTQNSGVGGFTNIAIEDCYGENAGNNFAFMDIKSYDIHDIRVVGWRHSQEAGNTKAIINYRGALSASTAYLHLERIFPPTNTTNLVNLTQDISGAIIKNCRGLLTSDGVHYIYNADVRMWADDIYNSAPAGSYVASALLPGAYTIAMDKYPVAAGFSRQRPSAVGTTQLVQTVAPNSLLWFKRSESNVYDVTVSAGVNSTIESPASNRVFEDSGINYDAVGNFEVVILNFSNATTLKHNYTANSAFKWMLKSNADTSYAAGKLAQFIRNGNSFIEL